MGETVSDEAREGQWRARSIDEVRHAEKSEVIGSVDEQDHR